MTGGPEAPEVHDLGPSDASARKEIVAGLTSAPKRLSPKYFYDQRGSELFDAICEQPEYYPTRTEIGILTENAGDIAAALGPGVLVIEPGSGSSVKIRLLLDALEAPRAYAPVEISREHLEAAAGAINAAYPGLEVLPVHADFTRPFRVPDPEQEPVSRLMYFPGSTIGNFEPAEAAALLEQWRDQLGPGDALLLGVDMVKDLAVLNAAYNDKAGLSAAFNLNILAHVNRLAGGNLDAGKFSHRAFYNEEAGRIEMHLVSRTAQVATVGGKEIRFVERETIHTENSYKYTPEKVARLAAEAGYVVERSWTDSRRWFSVNLLRAT